MEGIGSLPLGRRKRNSCSLLSSLILSSLSLSSPLTLPPASLCSVVSFLSPPQKSLCNIPLMLAVQTALALCLSPLGFPSLPLLVPERRSDTSRVPTPESAATCMCWRWLWGPGLKALGKQHLVCSPSLPSLRTRFVSITAFLSRSQC